MYDVAIIFPLVWGKIKFSIKKTVIEQTDQLPVFLYIKHLWRASLNCFNNIKCYMHYMFIDKRQNVLSLLFFVCAIIMDIISNWYHYGGKRRKTTRTPHIWKNWFKKTTSTIFQSTFHQRAATIVYTIRNPHPTVRFLRPSVVQSNITQEYGYGNQWH